MKKIILTGIIIALLYSCKKEDSVIVDDKAKVAASWIIGTWNVQSATDTVYNGTKIVSVHTDFTGNPLIFNDEYNGYTVNDKPFTYDLAKMIINFDGRNSNIVKISDTRLNITGHNYTTQQGSLTEYIKKK